MFLTQSEISEEAQRKCAERYPWTGVKKFVFDITVADIKRFFRTRYAYARAVGMFEFGTRGGSYRLDALIVDCYKEMTRGFEFKTTRADFMADKKWPGYRRFCNTLAFVTPYDMIQKEELPADIGLLQVVKYYYEGSEDNVQVSAVWRRKPRRRDIDREVYVTMISLMLQKMKFRDGDFF